MFNMAKLFFILIVILLPRSIVSEEIEAIWLKKVEECKQYLARGNYKDLKMLALELNQIDPTDTQAMYFIVLSHVRLGEEVPKWIVNSPWPDSTVKDREFYINAMELIGGT